MPFNVNNVDATVAANALYGMVSRIQTSPEIYLPKLTPEIESLMWNTGLLLEYVLRTNQLEKRPDLVLLYYPPIYDFYWFTARLVKQLSSSSFKIPLPIFEKLSTLLNTAIKTYGE